MSLKIYNSLTNKIEEFVPRNEKVVNMYVCGPTVYNYIHIGNARPVIFYDMLKNYLTFLGYKVNYASNITDVDDKIINKAIAEGKTEKEIAGMYEDAYFKSSLRLNSKKPDFIPHATDYILDMQELIEKLVETGYAYSVDGDVFFRVSKLADYGILSNQNKDELESGARISVDEKKESPLDFALWKKTDKGIKWPFKYGEGRPGWHTECVCMINRLFNNQEIDIHGGGADLKFPHHENEIAQSKAYNNHNLSKYWMHVARLNFGKEKMSKSLGNVILVNDLKEEELAPFRLLICATPYRNIIEYSNELLAQYEKEYQKYERAYKQASLMLDLADIDGSDLDEQMIEKFKNEMDQDLNTANVLTVLSEIVKKLNVAIRQKDYDNTLKLKNTLKTILDIFGVKIEYKKLDAENKELYLKWENFKKEKNFDEADKVRNLLIERGII